MLHKMQWQIKQDIFHEYSKNYKWPSKGDVIEWTESAWENIEPGPLDKVVMEFHIHAYDWDDDDAYYSPLYGGVDINSDF